MRIRLDNKVLEITACIPSGGEEKLPNQTDSLPIYSAMNTYRQYRFLAQFCPQASTRRSPRFR